MAVSRTQLDGGPILGASSALTKFAKLNAISETDARPKRRTGNILLPFTRAARFYEISHWVQECFIALASMPAHIVKMTNQTLPVLPLRDIVVFPHRIVPLFVGREKSVAALEAAMGADKQLFLVAQLDPAEDDPDRDALYDLGVIATAMQLLKLPDGTVRVLVEGAQRARLVALSDAEGHQQAEVVLVDEEVAEGPEAAALMRSVIDQFENYAKLNKRLPAETSMQLSEIDNPSVLADAVASNLSIKVADKQALLGELNPARRLEMVFAFMEGELGVLQVEKKIRSRVKRQMEKTQREYYLNEQLKAIQRELGNESEDGGDELNELAGKIRKTRLSKEARNRANAELKKLRAMAPMSAEATVARNYLDVLLGLPWGKKSRLKRDIAEAQRVLDEDHYGLEKVKERIVEYLAVQARTNRLKGPILCLVGPPGVGKTSLGRSIARATGREFARQSLGGVRDEAEIRGHRRTYIGSLPGKIISNLKKAGTSNPLFLLDEIDKLGQDFRGDPSSALLEVEIAKRHLVPKQIEAHGLKEQELVFSDEGLRSIIRHYTREAGVRTLERELAKIARKSLRQILEGKAETVTLAAENVGDFLGVRKFRYGVGEEEDQIGAVTGLAWTEVGGELLTIEAVTVPGKGQIKTTGKLGEVMQESIQAAMSFVKARAPVYGVKPSIFSTKDIHVHLPEGAVPKDGPSAGIGMVTAMISTLTAIPVRRDVAMTGEVTLRGRVLPIGGLKEKLLAALRGGIRIVLIPAENEKDLAEIPAAVKEALEIIPVSHVDEVLAKALTKAMTPIEWTDPDEQATQPIIPPAVGGDEATVRH
jgi:ATP-dependent Lon protease